MEITLILSFLAASILLTLMPGPDILFVITQSLGRGYKVGMAIATGLVSGILVHTTLAATGLGLMLRQWDLAFEILKYAGAIYLFYLAYKASQEQYTEPNTTDEFKKNKELNFIASFKTGFIMNVLNPKVTLFFIALLPQFVSENGFNPIFQMMILGLIFMIQALVIFYLVAFTASYLSQSMQGEKFWKITKWLRIIILSLLGIIIIKS